MTEAGDKTATLLAALWVRNRPVVEERLAILDRAAVDAATGTLGDSLRVDAAGSAHKLAGSLGMYGFDEGTRVAREIEVLLGGAAPHAARLSELIAELRVAIFPVG
jgi:HPt (histidine-containing phosphotransfer) domain-containing protein